MGNSCSALGLLLATVLWSVVVECEGLRYTFAIASFFYAAATLPAAIAGVKLTHSL